MPSGRTHAKVTAYLTLPAAGLGALGGLVLSGSPLTAFLYAASCGVGCLAGILLTPDLDQESINTVEYKIIKYTLGLGFLWTMIWFPYALLTDHRGTISHFPVIGTLGRILYISIFLAVAALLGWKLPSVPLAYLSWGVVGLLVSDIAHWALDVKYGDPWDKKRKRK